MKGGKKSSVNGMVDIDIYKSTVLKNGKSQNVVTETFSDYHSLVEKTFEMFNGESWHRMGDGGIFRFPTPEDAVNTSLRLLNDLVEFNEKKNQLNLPLFIRIGIHQIGKKDIKDVPKDERGKYAHPALDIAGKLQKNCPIGKIAVSVEVYNRIGFMQCLFKAFISRTSRREIFCSNRSSYYATGRRITLRVA